MNESCRPFREQLGSLALAHLDDAEATAVRAHLDGCADCRAEFSGLREVAQMLPLADPARLGEPSAAPPSGLGERVFSLVRAERRLAAREHRSRLVAIGSAAAVVTAIVVALVVATPSDPAIAVTLDPSVPEATAPIHATLTSRPWGTEIRLDVRGLPRGEAYAVWLREPNDERTPAGSFTAVADGDEVVLSSSLPLDEAAGIGISDGGGETMLYGHLPDEW
ncbi:MAG TPA: zf-HC2 domain-containing protein [Actinomycetota bacterium]|nr:zf-HC2 domain-containing protein [Actinomycetota bacterium]